MDTETGRITESMARRSKSPRRNDCPICGFHVNVQKVEAIRKGQELYHPYCHRVREEIAALRKVLGAGVSMLDDIPHYEHEGALYCFYCDVVLAADTPERFTHKPTCAWANLREAVQEAQAHSLGKGTKGEATE